MDEPRPPPRQRPGPHPRPLSSPLEPPSAAPIRPPIQQPEDCTVRRPIGPTATRHRPAIAAAADKASRSFYHAPMNSSRLSARTPAVPTLARRPLSTRLALALGLLALGGCSTFQPSASAAVNAPHVTAKAGPDSQAPHSPTKPGNQATGNSPSPDSLATQEQATGGAQPSDDTNTVVAPDAESDTGSALSGTYRPANLPELTLTPPLVYEILAAEVALQREQPGAAYATYHSLAAQTGDARLARRATEIAIVTGSLADALDSARLWVRLDPTYPNARKALDTLLLANGRVTEAEPALTRQLTEARKAGTLDTAYPQLQEKLLNLPDRRAAWALAQRLSAPDLDNVQARLMRARLAHEAGQQQAAADEALAAQQLAPDNIEAVLASVQLLQSQPGGRQRAAALLGNYLQKHPDDLRALKAQGLLQIASEQNDAAIATLSRVQSLEPDNPATLYTLAQLHHQKRDYARATEALQRYVALPENIERDNGNAFLFLSEIAQKQNDNAGAIQWLERVPTDSRVHFEAQLTRASLLARQSRPEAGLAALSTLKPRNLRETQLQTVARAQILREAGRYQAAFDVLDRAIRQRKDDKDTIDLLYDRAIAAEKVGRLDVLEKDLRRLIKLRPDDGNAYNALGYTLADHNQRLPEALTLIEKANQLNPGDPHIQDSLGWVYFRLGRTQDALDVFRTLWSKSPDTEVGTHYGEVLWHAGQQDAARDIWRQCRQQDPDNELLRDTLKRLGVTLQP